MPNRQVRISVAGTYQFTATVSQDETIEDVAQRALNVMGLGAYRPIFSVGQINFIPK